MNNNCHKNHRNWRFSWGHLFQRVGWRVKTDCFYPCWLKPQFCTSGASSKASDPYHQSTTDTGGAWKWKWQWILQMQPQTCSRCVFLYLSLCISKSKLPMQFCSQLLVFFAFLYLSRRYYFSLLDNQWIKVVLRIIWTGGGASHHRAFILLYFFHISLSSLDFKVLKKMIHLSFVQWQNVHCILKVVIFKIKVCHLHDT